jgi:uncharacterized membrane protein
VSARAEFLATLRAGLRGLPPSFVEDALGDYSAHFDDGTRDGRGEADVAKALGDPLALADELRAEAQVSRWESTSSASAGWRVITQSVARGALHASMGILVLPLLSLIALALSLASIAALVGGTWFLLAGHGFDMVGGAATVLLAGFGLIAAGVSLGALTLLGVTALINLLARRTRGAYQHLQRKKTGAST